MRSKLTISLILLTVTIAAGILTGNAVRTLSQRYISAAEELHILTEDGQWQRAEEAAKAYLSAWQKSAPYLHMLINHEDVDGVNLALTRFRLAIATRDIAMCRDASAELRESARQVYQRDAFTLANVF